MHIKIQSFLFKLHLGWVIPIYERLAFQIKSCYTKFTYWRYNIESSDCSYMREKTRQNSNEIKIRQKYNSITY